MMTVGDDFILRIFNRVNPNYVHTDANFQFFQPSYQVVESVGFVSICLELVSGTLTDDITIEINNYESFEVTATCKYAFYTNFHQAKID